MRVDKGAISFVMNGANIMCQGFTSKGGRIETPLEAGAPVVSHAHQKGQRTCYNSWERLLETSRAGTKGTMGRLWLWESAGAWKTPENVMRKGL